MGAKKEINPAMAVIVIVVVIAIVGLIIWRMTGVSPRKTTLPGEMMGKYGAKMPGGPGKMQGTGAQPSGN